MEIDKNIAFAKKLAKSGMTYKELAEKAKVSVCTVKNGLDGKRLSPRSCHKIAKALSCEPEQIGMFPFFKSTV